MNDIKLRSARSARLSREGGPLSLSSDKNGSAEERGTRYKPHLWLAAGGVNVYKGSSSI